MQDFGIGGQAFPLARTQRRCTTICEDLPHLSNGEVRQSGKSRLLRPLEIPSRKWAHVTTDLVTDLPDSDGYTAIAVFVDKLTKMVHLALAVQKRLQPWNMQSFLWIMSSDYTVSPRSLYLIGILALPASFGSHCLTCSVRISSSVLHSIRKPMVSLSG